MARQIIIDFHKTHSNQAVEPSIGNLLNDVLIGSLVICIFLFSLNQLYKMSSLTDCFSYDRIRFCRSDIIKLRLSGGLRKSSMNSICRNSHKACTIADISDQFISRPDGEVLYGGLIHSYAIPSLSVKTPHLRYRSRSVL